MNCSYVSLNQILEPAEGDDPTTYGLQNHCSTNVSYTGKNSTHVVLRPNAIKKVAVCVEKWLCGPDSNRQLGIFQTGYGVEIKT